MKIPRSGLALALMFAGWCSRATAETYLFTTLAGEPGYGSADGAAAEARFSGPRSVAVDARGNVYVADYGNHTIRKITADGVVSTLAGSAGHFGSADGMGSAARFSVPEGVAVDTSGNVYVADTGNHAIRKITPDGMVTTLAGQGGLFGGGSVDGTGSAARFLVPRGVAVDAGGNVFVADTNNNAIRKITPAGVVTTFAGQLGVLGSGSTDGTGNAARFNGPQSITVDSSGNVLVADTFNFTIRKITPAGVVTTLAGSPGGLGTADGAGSAAQFGGPRGVAVDGGGNVFVADASNTIRRVSAAGIVTTLAGRANSPGTIDGAGSADGTGNAARFDGPTGVAVDGAGNVLVADANNGTIRKVSVAGSVTTFAGTARSRSTGGSADGTGGAARFSRPRSVAVDSNENVFVADTSNHAIRKITSAGVVTTLAGSPGSSGSVDGAGAAARFNSPAGLAVEAGGNLFVADSANHAIRKITTNGVVTTLAGAAGTAGTADGTAGAARFNNPQGVGVDGSGNVYVADTGNHTIRKISAAGVVTTLAGAAGSSGSADGTGGTARFNGPTGLAVDGGGSVLVADTRNGTIRKISASGVVTTVAGLAGSFGSTDGAGSVARFNSPSAVAVAADGNVLVIDTNGTIRRISADGVVTTVAGDAGGVGYADGPGGTVLFNGPTGIAVAAGGNLFIADFSNNAIRKGVPVAAAGSSRLINLSVRSVAGAGADTLIVGFSLAGSGTKPMLIRGVGPTLTAFGVGGALADPTLRLDILNGALVAQNDNWETFTGAGAAAIITSTAASVGAFALPAGSRDAALLPTLNAGTYTAQVGGGIGVALVEVYDAGVDASIRLNNLSARTRSGTGGDILIAGFVIAGDAPKTLLIRGIGPALVPFGVTGALVDPRLQLFSGTRVVAENDDWAGTSALSGAFAQTGAFGLAATSKDAAMLVTLSPGSYTAQVSGVGGATGVALIEVYEMP